MSESVEEKRQFLFFDSKVSIRDRFPGNDVCAAFDFRYRPMSAREFMRAAHKGDELSRRRNVSGDDALFAIIDNYICPHVVEWSVCDNDGNPIKPTDREAVANMAWTALKYMQDAIIRSTEDVAELAKK